MNCADFGVGFSGQKPEQLVLALHRVGLRPPLPVPNRPETSEDGEWSVLLQREPGRRLARLRIGIFAKGRERHHASVLRFEPGAPVRTLYIADVGDGGAAESGRT